MAGAGAGAGAAETSPTTGYSRVQPETLAVPHPPRVALTNPLDGRRLYAVATSIPKNVEGALYSLLDTYTTERAVLAVFGIPRSVPETDRLLHSATGTINVDTMPRVVARWKELRRGWSTTTPQTYRKLWYTQLQRTIAAHAAVFDAEQRGLLRRRLTALAYQFSWWTCACHLNTTKIPSMGGLCGSRTGTPGIAPCAYPRTVGSTSTAWDGVVLKAASALLAFHIAAAPDDPESTTACATNQGERWLGVASELETTQHWILRGGPITLGHWAATARREGPRTTADGLWREWPLTANPHLMGYLACVARALHASWYSDHSAELLTARLLAEAPRSPLTRLDSPVQFEERKQFLVRLRSAARGTQLECWWWWCATAHALAAVCGQTPPLTIPGKPGNRPITYVCPVERILDPVLYLRPATAAFRTAASECIRARAVLLAFAPKNDCNQALALVSALQQNLLAGEPGTDRVLLAAELSALQDMKRGYTAAMTMDLPANQPSTVQPQPQATSPQEEPRVELLRMTSFLATCPTSVPYLLGTTNTLGVLLGIGGCNKREGG